MYYGSGKGDGQVILVPKSKCTGCSACVSICPQKCLQMQKDEYGFLHPILSKPDLCVNCGLCGGTCPVHNKLTIPSGGTEAYAVYSENSVLRGESSSGGIFSELALTVLGKNGAVYGAAYDERFRISHICVEKTEDLGKLRGAKYAQSDLDDTFFKIKRRLVNGQQVLFAGTLCQVAGLKSYLKTDYEGLLTIDFVCHGVPSPVAWERYVQWRAAKDNDGGLPETINLRSKSTGWSRYRYSNVYQYAGGRQYSAKSGEDLYMRLFVGDYINRESCTDCHFKGYNRVSDITLGDFWGIWDIAPEMDDDSGTSLILLHSEKGKQTFAELKGRAKYQPVTLEQASAQNPSLLYSSPAKPQRGEILQMAFAGDFDAIPEKIGSGQKQPGVGMKILQRLKRAIRR